MTTPGRRPKIVLLGMLTKMPVGGVMWLVRQYAAGFERLGYDVYYVEAHGRVPSMLMAHKDDDATANAVSFLAREMKRAGMEGRWAFHALHDDGRCYGLSEAELGRLYREAALILNLHGCTVPRQEHSATGRLVYLGTDPVDLELELHRGEQHAIDYLEPHIAYFTWGLNYGNPDCRLPWSERFPFVPSPPPVVVDFWRGIPEAAPARAFTTVGNWRQPWRKVEFQGEVYTWSKHSEFLKIVDLPHRVDQAFELALGSYQPDDQDLLEAHGWTIRPSLEFSRDPERYRAYVANSRGELTAAKDQNVRFRTGWFSERSATYLAAGRPVVQQDTGFGNVIPTGAGVFAFSDLDGAVAAVEAVNSDYAANRRAATEIAREFFNYDVVLPDILERAGAEVPVPPRRREQRRVPVPSAPTATSRPVPMLWPRPPVAPVVSIVVVAGDDLDVTRRCLESVLAATVDPPYEVVVVAGEPSDDTRRYLSVLAARNRNVRLLESDPTGLAAARGEILVLLDGDAEVTSDGWLALLVEHLREPGTPPAVFDLGVALRRAALSDLDLTLVDQR